MFENGACTHSPTLFYFAPLLHPLATFHRWSTNDLNDALHLFSKVLPTVSSTFLSTSPPLWPVPSTQPGFAVFRARGNGVIIVQSGGRDSPPKRTNEVLNVLGYRSAGPKFDLGAVDSGAVAQLITEPPYQPVWM